MKIVIEKTKTKMVKQYESANENDLSILQSFSRTIVFLSILPYFTHRNIIFMYNASTCYLYF